MSIKKGYYEHPPEVWDEKKCKRLAKHVPVDAFGTKAPFSGYLGSWSVYYGGYGYQRYNGGCIRDGDWYEGEYRPLPTLAPGYKIVHVTSWGYRIVDEKTYVEPGPLKNYLYSWIAAIHLARTHREEYLCLEEPTTEPTWLRDSKVFKTREAAELAIRKAFPPKRLRPCERLAVRKYVYMTCDPKNAKGLREWTKEDSEAWEFLDCEV